MWHAVCFVAKKTFENKVYRSGDRVCAQLWWAYQLNFMLITLKGLNYIISVWFCQYFNSICQRVNDDFALHSKAQWARLMYPVNICSRKRKKGVFMSNFMKTKRQSECTKLLLGGYKMYIREFIIKIFEIFTFFRFFS
jgi:hypothetical protein